MDTARIAAPISGDKLYQQRARAALPVLVRQAEAGVPIFYSALAQELGMPNPRNLNYVLGSIGSTLEDLSKAWEEAIPPIQCLVVNKQTGLPGEGIWWFLVKEQDFAALDRRRQRAIVEAELHKIFAYRRWRDVLKALSLAPVKADFRTEIEQAAAERGGGGESEEHLRLKEYVARNPSAVGLEAGTPRGDVEYELPSGDTIDVLFRDKKDWVAVEVKSRISDDADVLRGLFQCVKYRALVEAVQVASELPQNARALLVLEGELPAGLVALRNLLGIEVVEMVRGR
ncbi:MAG: hypothetical protein NTX87_11685 [Planctomycetota bacterium]|nr:hypothetical protein [Planctomycetota bacterium]